MTCQPTIYLSKKGIKELKKTISRLERDHQRVLQSLREMDKTTSHEDRLEYVERLALLDGIEIDLFDKKDVLKRSKLLPNKRRGVKVTIGSVVDLIDRHGHFFRYKIVDSVEADPSDGRISACSPLGQSLIGKKVKESFTWQNGNIFNQFRLVRIV